jgi:NitT/TauT family transport system substrate-binding protein
MDTLPLYVAEEQGYYEAEDVVVEFIPVGSAPERDQLIQSGQADAMINELLSTMFYNASDAQVVTVRNARVPTPEFPHFYVLAAGNNDIETAADLAGVEIGVSQATIIEYGTERMLAASGLDVADIATVAIPRIPDRLALLGSGELAAANMPDPLAALAVQGGARVVVDDSQFPQYGGSVITFRQAFVEEQGEAVEGFLRAVEQAVADINDDKDAWSGLLSDRELVPPPLLDSYVIPDFPTASIPPRSQWDDMLTWATQKGYVQGAPAYETSVSDAYLP